MEIVDHPTDDAGVEEGDQVAPLGDLVQRKIRRVVVVAARIDDLEPAEPAIGKVVDRGRFGLVDVDHGERHDQVRVPFTGLFDQVVAFTWSTEQAQLEDVQPLAVVRQHVEHAVGGIEGQLRAAGTPWVVDVGVEHAPRRVLDIGGAFDLVHLNSA